MMLLPDWFGTIQSYLYAQDPPKANAAQLKRPLASIWDGPLISTERDGSE